METRANKDVPTDFLINLLQLVLKWNLFEFDEKIFRQLIGTAIGTKLAPNYADIVMAVIDELILKAAAKHGDGTFPISFYKRFLDDIFFVFLGSHKKLHEFLDEMNQIHPAIRFTICHTKLPGAVDTCECPELDKIPFLDTTISVKNNLIVTDLYRKPSDRVQYLLPSSCHPNHCHKNIPYSLALRIVRICSEPESRDARFDELKDMLKSWNYQSGLITSAINRAKDVPRSEALKRVNKNQAAKRQVFVVRYDPRMPSMPSIIHKHYRSMTTINPELKETFPLPPLVAYKDLQISERN